MSVNYGYKHSEKINLFSSMSINIDSAIFIGFLAVNLIVGLKYSTKLLCDN